MAFACLLSALTTGCSSGSGGDDSPSALMDAVGHISTAGTKGGQVSYLDAARVRSLEKGDSRRFRAVGQAGSPLMTDYRFNAHAYGLDPAMIDTDVTNGYAGHWQGSFDADRVTATLEAGGFARRPWHGTGSRRLSKSAPGPRTRKRWKPRSRPGWTDGRCNCASLN